MSKQIKRYIEETPQRFKVVGYSVKPTVQLGKISMDIKVSKSAPLDVTPFFDKMTFVNI